MATDEAWEDLAGFSMSRADAFAVIAQAPGAAVTWARRDGHTLAVWVSHALLDGELFVTTTDNRPKTRAWRRDGRTSAVFGVPGLGTVTVVGRVVLSDDPGLRRRFLVALAEKLGIAVDKRESWIGHMDSDGRLTGHVEVEKLITFDERKLVF